MTVRFLISVKAFGYSLFARNASESYSYTLRKGDKIIYNKAGWK